METHLLKLKQVWDTLGAEDPLWAVFSRPDKRGGRWELAEFLATGDQEVARFRRLMQSRQVPCEHFKHILDFGCGVGRLSLAWRKYADRVTGVDIAEPMVAQARRLATDQAGLDFIVNPRADLATFPDGAFDLCFSHICLQHMPWSLARGYLREFARVCSPGAAVAFQLPASRTPVRLAASLRQRLVESLPFGLDRAYRRWRHGSSRTFEVYYTPPEVVRGVLADAGLELLSQEPDASAGDGTEGFLYLARKKL